MDAQSCPGQTTHIYRIETELGHPVKNTEQEEYETTGLEEKLRNLRTRTYSRASSDFGLSDLYSLSGSIRCFFGTNDTTLSKLGSQLEHRRGEVEPRHCPGLATATATKCCGNSRGDRRGDSRAAWPPKLVLVRAWRTRCECLGVDLCILPTFSTCLFISEWSH